MPPFFNKKRDTSSRQFLLNISLPNLTTAQIIPTSHNLTETKDPTYLVYNRVPKCGSSTMTDIMAYLEKINNFAVQATGWMANLFTTDQQTKILIEKLTKIKKNKGKGKLAFNSHIYYLDYEKFNFNPILMNHVRDPVERIISKEGSTTFHPP